MVGVCHSSSGIGGGENGRGREKLKARLPFAELPVDIGDVGSTSSASELALELARELSSVSVDSSGMFSSVGTAMAELISRTGILGKLPAQALDWACCSQAQVWTSRKGCEKEERSSGTGNGSGYDRGW